MVSNGHKQQFQRVSTAKCGFDRSVGRGRHHGGRADLGARKGVSRMQNLPSPFPQQQARYRIELEVTDYLKIDRREAAQAARDLKANPYVPNHQK